MECEEDSNTILSLPHTLLQSDNGTSTSTQSAEKSQQWLEGSPSEGTSSAMSGHFSMISPSLTYNSTQGSSNQLTTNSSKYYGSTNSAGAFGPSNHNFSSLIPYSVPEHRILSTNFSGTRSSMCHSSSSASNGFEFNPASVNHSNNNEMTEYYQPSSYRNSVNLYSNRGSVESSSDNFVHSNNRHFDEAQSGNSSILSHTTYEHGSTEIDESVEISKPINRHHLQPHQHTADIMEFSESFFDSRSKHLEYSKDQGDIYNVSPAKTNATFSHEVTTPMDKRQLEMNSIVPELDFSLGARDFGPVGSNSRPDYAPITRSADLDYRFDQDQSSEYLSQDLTAQKYSVPSSQGFDAAINARKMPTVHSEFTVRQNIDQNSYSGPKKAINEHTEMVFVHKEQVAGSRSSERHKFSPDSKKTQDTFLKEGNNDQLSNQNAAKAEESWSGRSRAHRKMVRLLGQAPCKEKSEKPPDSSTHQGFGKKIQNLAEYGSPQESSKSQEVSRNHSYQEVNFRISRNVSQTEKLGPCERRDEDLGRNLNSVRDYNNSTTLGISNSSAPLTSLLPNQHLLSSTSALDLEFQQSLAQRELELNPQLVLQVSKDLGMEENLTENVNQVELFGHHMDPHQIAPTSFPFADNLNAPCPQEINLDSYLIPPDKDNSFSKKFSYHNQRNLSTETEFNIEEYMAGQVDKDLTPAYFDRTDVPQDMTMYQKISPDKSTGHNSAKFKERDCTPTFKTAAKQNDNICELQKELTKSSGKESMKGIRIPRDIHRAMGILQDLQETEKEEEKRKKELERQQQNEIQEAQHMHQQHQQQQQQQQHQKYQHSTSINSSPKKTFQNKHQIESMALTEQQLLSSMPTNFIEDQSVENVSFLDQSSYCFPDQSAGTSGFCDPNLQEISQYSGFSSLYQPADVDMAASLSSKQRDYQHVYHILKRLAFSEANIKDMESNISSLQTSSWLAGNSAQTEPELNFNLGMPRISDHLSTLTEGPPSKFPVTPGADENRAQCHSEAYPDISSQQRPSFDSDKFQNFSSFGDAGDLTVMDSSIQDKTNPAMDVMDTSRQNLYIMMKQEQLCDVILSTSKVEVMVHQTILCSMSPYLSNLLLPPGQSSLSSESTKPMPSTGSSFSQPSKFKNFNYSHKSDRHHLVMLIINCDSIKSSSITAFLMFIYLGKTEFSESNVIDLFILASSLHVLTLKTLCLEFMWQTHISEEEVKIPPLQISKTGLETRDQSCYANFGNMKSMADKGVCVGHSPPNMDVASQTDRTTSKVGGGGQEEWVMLKKTKQKTVSPSKSKTGLTGKGPVVQENQPVFKPGKKPWLSPKRRFKSELLAQAKSDQSSLTKIKDKDIAESLDLKRSANGGEEQTRELMENLDTFFPPHRSAPASKRPRMIPVEKNASKEENVDFINNLEIYPSLRHVKTTVEIAEEAAAAKISAHTSSTRQASKGVRKSSLSSISSQEVGYSNHNTTAMNPKDQNYVPIIEKSLAHTQREELRQLNSESGGLKQDMSIVNCDVNASKQTRMHREVELSLTLAQESNNSNNNMISTLPVSEKPVKKKIIQLALSQESLVPELSSTSTTSPKTIEQPNKSLNLSEEKPVPDHTNVFTSTDNNADFPVVINEGDLSHVSSFFDSIMIKMGSETEDAELQKVIHDLDSELYRPQIISVPVTSSSVLPSSSSLSSLTSSSSSSSSSSPTDVPSISTSSSSSVQTTTTASSTSSVPRSKSTAQGFRKRLIQLVKSENLKLSSMNVPPQTTKNPPDEKLRLENENMSSGVGVASCEKLPAVTDLDNLPSLAPEENTGVKDQGGRLTSLSEQQPKNKVTGVGVEEEMNGSASDKCKDGTVTEDYDTQFHHKIFKRKRKSKPRKITNSEGDSTMCPKLKTKKFSGVESETAGTKARQRRNTTSDTEGGGMRSKTKKVGSNEVEGGMIRNVRPPPKKRAKMELEMLKVAGGENRNGNEISEKTACDDKGVQVQEEVKAKVDKENKILTNSNTGDEKTEVKTKIKTDGGEIVKRSTEENTKSLETIGKRTEKVVKLTKSKPQKAKKNNLAVTDDKPESKPVTPDAKESPKTCSKSKESPELSVESQYASRLHKQFVQSGLKRRIFSCKVCKSHLKSALVSVKHVMLVHKFQGEEILQNINVGFAENGHEACDICGYVTKDQTYKYMHYHKYFKHSVPLPLGLSVHKCHMCCREFQTSYQLNEHAKGHDDNFSFTCWYCGQNFKSRNNMNNHVFHKHSKQRDHTCKICDKAFKTWTQLKVHVRIHTGDRPFSCSECDYGSTTLGNMRHHLSHKHRMEVDGIKEAMIKIKHFNLQIAERKPEITPAALDELMNMVLSRTIPDKAKKLSEGKGNNKTILKSKKEDSDKSTPVRKNIRKIALPSASTLTLKSVKKSAFKEAISRNCKIIPIPDSPKLLNDRPQGGLQPIACRKPATPKTSSQELSLPLTQQKPMAIISQPILANNIVIVPPTVGHQVPKLESVVTLATTTSPGNQPVPVGISSHERQRAGSGSLPISPDGVNCVPQCAVATDTGTQGLSSDTVTKREPDTVSTLQNSISATDNVEANIIINPNDSLSISPIPTRTAEALFTSPTTAGEFTLSTQQPSSNVVLMPVTTLNAKTYPEFDMTHISNILPSNQLGQCASSVVYANQPVVLQSPMVANGAVYQGMPSFIMYSCQPSQSSVLQIQGVSDLQMVPTAATPGIISSSGEVPLFAEQQTVVTVNTGLDIQAENSTEQVVTDANC